LSIEPVALKWPAGVALVAAWRLADGLCAAVSVAPAVGLAVATSIGLALGIELVAAEAEGDGDPAGPPGRPTFGPLRQAAKPTPATRATVTAAATPTNKRGRAQVPDAPRARRAPIAAPTSFVALTESPGAIEL
jgi:creatinine amidohydrolase/Fe(II)-dependent formamide hydrolase-like protein